MADVTICDWKDCGEFAVVSVKLIDVPEWKGMEYDACNIHCDEPLSDWISQWEREAKDGKTS